MVAGFSSEAGFVAVTKEMLLAFVAIAGERLAFWQRGGLKRRNLYSNASSFLVLWSEWRENLLRERRSRFCC